jgi:GUN4-like/Caspase domain
MANNWAIVVGINNYKFLPNASLKFAEQDALAIRQFLCEEAGFAADQVLLCGDGTAGSREATRAVLRQILLNELHRAQNADNLWFFFSGHGLSDQRDYLMPIDGNPHDLHDTAIPIHFVVDQLRACQAKNIVLILDMCRNERPETERKSVESVEALRQLVQDREGQQGIITLFSCGRGESSYELPGLGQGAFTYALLEGLRRQSILRDLEMYLARRVPELHREAGRATRKQVPLVIPEPGWKYEEPILSHYVTAPQRPPVQSKPQPQKTIDDIPLESEKGVDYRKLRNLLKAEKWEEADRETLRVMLIAAGQPNNAWPNSKSLKEFPYQDLKAIDQLWVTASNGHFGFSIQTKIYADCGDGLDDNYSGDLIWQNFCDHVGWRVNKDWMEYANLKKNPSISPLGELPCLVVGGGKGWGIGFLGFVGFSLPLGWSFFSYANTCQLWNDPKIDSIPLEPERRIDYGKLRDLLEAQKWEEADQATLDIMLKVANRTSEGWLDEDSLEEFPRKVLAILDQLWVAASQGHFGFSVQKKFWRDCGSPTDSGFDWNSFCVKVGWKSSDATTYYDSDGKNYKSYKRDYELKRNLTNSPEGELPWLMGEVGGHQAGSRSRLWGTLFMRRSL